jgi:hypothetical protein
MLLTDVSIQRTEVRASPLRSLRPASSRINLLRTIGGLSEEIMVVLCKTRLDCECL